MENSIYTFSLLHPYDETSCFELNKNTENDLSVDFIAENLSEYESERFRIKNILMSVPCDRKTIEYRQAVFKDLRNYPEVSLSLRSILDDMNFYTNDSRNVYEKSTIWELVHRLHSLQNYVESVKKIQGLFHDVDFKSQGMKDFAGYINEIYTDSGFDELSKDLSLFDGEIEQIHSMTLGVNFDNEFYPEEVGIISLNKFWFERKGILSRFMDFARKKDPEDGGLSSFSMMTHPPDNDSPLMNNLTGIVEQMMPSVTRKLHRILKKYTDISGNALTRRADELMFYIKFIELERKLENIGMPVFIPDFSKEDTHLSDFYNIKLAICLLNKTVDTKIICNDLSFTKDKNVMILTGPNRGGKTIFTQGIGLAQLLFQHGVFVPCSSGRMKIADGIFTHFPADENDTVSLGRLGEESDRFRKICTEATSESLLLLNESFATTSHTESLYIAQDVVKYICCLGARTCYNTHMHELAEDTEMFRTEDSLCGAVSVVMGKREGESAFRISYEKPDGKSYAHDIAEKFGITFEQLRNNASAQEKK